MSRGRKPKPLALKVLAGNPGRRPLTNTPTGTKFAAGVPDCPKHLGKVARAEWKRVTAELNAAGVLATADRGVVAAFCDAWADLVAFGQDIEKNGHMIDVPLVDRNAKPTGGTARRVNPAVRYRSEAGKRVQSLGAELGLSPASRSRIGAGQSGGASGREETMSERAKRIQAGENPPPSGSFYLDLGARNMARRFGPEKKNG
jgi:P27 family predicted phage terminase small subunit